MSFFDRFRRTTRPRQAPPENALDELCRSLGGAKYERLTVEAVEPIGIRITLANGDSFVTWGKTTAEAVERAVKKGAKWPR
jgi:hypothetical protein